MPNSTKLALGKTRWDSHVVFKAVTNGSSEFLSNVSSSIVSMLYNYQLGAHNFNELKNVFSKSLKLIMTAGIIMTGLAVVMAYIFENGHADLLALSTHAIRIYSLSYLFMGFNIFGSAFFTAMNNGAISALISFLRTLVFQVFAVFLLPVFFGIDGIWSAIIVAEELSLLVTVICFIKYRRVYHYA